MPETVFVAAKRRRVVHLSPECPRLRQSRRTREVDRSAFPHREVCPFCGEGDTFSVPPREDS